MEVKERFDIEGRAYETVKLDPLRATEVHAEVVSAFGDGVPSLMGSLDLKEGNRAVMLAILGSIAKANTKKLFGLIPVMMSEVVVDKKRLISGEFNLHFKDYPQDLYPVFAWALAVNITPFLEGGGQGWKAFIAALGFQSLEDGKKRG